jgi:hypothetical protein
VLPGEQIDKLLEEVVEDGCNLSIAWDLRLGWAVEEASLREFEQGQLSPGHVFLV